MLTISQVQSPSQIHSVQELLREYTTWALTLSAESKTAPTFHGLEEELAALPGIYAPPGGRLLLAIHDGLPAGCIALKPHDPATAELKRVYVRPSFRGLKIGQQLIASAVGAAREVGYRRLILDSHASMTKAHALYEEAGFRRVDAPPDFPEALKPIVVFMEMDLEPGPGENRDLSAELRQVFEFMIELDKLKAVLRRTKPVGLERYENPAEHSWQIALLALLLAERASAPIDRLRVVEILLVHDIPEIDAGDQIVYEGRSDARYAAELQAARRIFGLLPEPHATWCLERWMEYEARESKEAHFAYAVDRLMPLLQNLANEGQSWRENGVSLEKVLGVNAVMGDLLPSVWDQVRERLGEASALGLFGEPKRNPPGSS